MIESITLSMYTVYIEIMTIVYIILLYSYMYIIDLLYQVVAIYRFPHCIPFMKLLALSGTRCWIDISSRLHLVWAWAVPQIAYAFGRKTPRIPYVSIHESHIVRNIFDRSYSYQNLKLFWFQEFYPGNHHISPFKSGLGWQGTRHPLRGGGGLGCVEKRGLFQRPGWNSVVWVVWCL